MLHRTHLNDLINDLHRVARELDEEVEERAGDTGLTECREFIVDLTPRQNLVRLMVRVAHELNSLDQGGPIVPEDAQPVQYGPRDTTWGA